MGERVCVWLRGERVRGMCGAVRDVGRAHACAHTRAALLECVPAHTPAPPCLRLSQSYYNHVAVGVCLKF